MADQQQNATFHAFKASGKWCSSSRGYLAANVFQPYWDPTTPDTRRNILEPNNGRFPGLSSDGYEFILVIVPDEEVSYGFPVMLRPGQAANRID